MSRTNRALLTSGYSFSEETAEGSKWCEQASHMASRLFGIAINTETRERLIQLARMKSSRLSPNPSNPVATMLLWEAQSSRLAPRSGTRGETLAHPRQIMSAPYSTGTRFRGVAAPLVAPTAAQSPEATIDSPAGVYISMQIVVGDAVGRQFVCHSFVSVAAFGSLNHSVRPLACSLTYESILALYQVT